jgi:hypothetical protein
MVNLQYKKLQTWKERVVYLHAFHTKMQQELGTTVNGRQGGWGVRDSAEALEISVGAVSQGLRLAEAVIKNPDLGNCTESAALKMVLEVERLAKPSMDGIKLFITNSSIQSAHNILLKDSFILVMFNNIQEREALTGRLIIAGFKLCCPLLVWYDTDVRPTKNTWTLANDLGYAILAAKGSPTFMPGSAQIKAVDLISSMHGFLVYIIGLTTTPTEAIASDVGLSQEALTEISPRKCYKL